MSFSKEVKLEILKQSRSLDANFSMLAGEILSAGSLIVSNHKFTFEIISETEEVLNFIKRQLQKCFNLTGEKVCVDNIFDSGKKKFILSLDAGEGSRVLQALSIISTNRDGEVVLNRTIDEGLLQDEECKTAFLAGAFVGAGSVSVPTSENKGGYHMEWVCSTQEKARSISTTLAELDIISKQVERSGGFVVYIKGSDEICQILAKLGAVASMLNLENNKAIRSVRNNINRQSNCVSANLDKTLSASVTELKAIETIEQTIGINSLKQELKEIAIIRKENPQASLAEIAGMLDAKITRAGISLRLKKLVSIANDLGENNGQ